jgi:glycosyltransferase involved in cell wall biosynthesis
MTPPMRIGIDVRKLHPRAGQALYLWKLGVWLAEAGHNVELVTVLDRPERETPHERVRIHRLHDLSRARLRKYIADLELDAFLINPERARDYRGIHANVLRPGYGTEHYRQKLRSFRNPLTRAARTLLRYAPWALAERRWERRFYQDPDPPPEIVANSHYTRAEVLASYAVPADHVHVVHNGVDPDTFSPAERGRRREARRNAWGVPRDAVCLLFMAHNFRLKGLWQTLELLPEVRAAPGGRALHLLGAGSGTGKRQVRAARRRIRRHGLDGVVHLVGPVDPPIDALAAADMVIHLSWHDSFSFGVLEAMAAGLPVITTPFTGASELIEDGESGLIVHPGRPGEIGTAVRGLLDGERRRALGAAAARVAGSHTEDASFESYLEVFELARQRGGGPVR